MSFEKLLMLALNFFGVALVIALLHLHHLSTTMVEKSALIQAQISIAGLGIEAGQLRNGRYARFVAANSRAYLDGQR